MAITHIHATTVYVSNQDKAVDFYTNKLGFEVRTDMPFGPDFRWIEVAPPGGQTGFVLAYKFGEWSEETIGNSNGVVLSVEDMRSTYENLTAKGVKFVETPSEQPWGIQAIIEDPDGNTFVMVARPQQ